MEKSESGVQALDLLILTWTHPENLDGVAAGRRWKGTCRLAAALEHTPLHRLASSGRDPKEPEAESWSNCSPLVPWAALATTGPAV